MLDIKMIRDNTADIEKALQAKNCKTSLNEVIQLDEQRRKLISQVDDLKAKKNQANDQITQLIKEKKILSPPLR